MLSYRKHGKPLVLATTSGNGSFDTSVQAVNTSLPSTGWITLRIAQNINNLTPIFIDTYV